MHILGKQSSNTQQHMDPQIIKNKPFTPTKFFIINQKYPKKYMQPLLKLKKKL